jgi:Domain of unknown function (DUF222)
VSWARAIAAWTGRIDHEELQSEADQILVEAAKAGADLDDLKLLAQAAYEAWRAQEPDPEDDPAGRGFGDRYLILDTTLDNAGHIRGDLTPECAAAVTAVIEALGKTRGPEDLRTAQQRYHDALQEACELLIRAKMVPDRAGADTRVDVIIPLSDLLGMDGASVVEDTWLRARAGEHGYLAGKDAEAVSCDAMIVPVVTGSPNWAVINEMITLITDAYSHAAAGPDPRPGPQPLPPKPGRPSSTPSPNSPSRSSPAPAPSPPPSAAASSAPPSTPAASRSTSATATPSPTPSAAPSSCATSTAPGPAAATAAPPPPTSTTSPTRKTADPPASTTAPCCATTTTTSASTASAGNSSSCPTDPPAPPAPTAKPSSAATHHPPQPNPAANTGSRLPMGRPIPDRPTPTPAENRPLPSTRRPRPDTIRPARAAWRRTLTDRKWAIRRPGRSSSRSSRLRPDRRGLAAGSPAAWPARCRRGTGGRRRGTARPLPPSARAARVATRRGR